MIFSYEELTIKDNEWATKKLPIKSITSALTIAVDAVVLDLDAGYFESCGEENNTTLKIVSESTYWQGSSCYISDEVFKVNIQNTWYVLSHLYIAENGDIIVVVSKPPEDIDFWEDLITQDISTWETNYFRVNY